MLEEEGISVVLKVFEADSHSDRRLDPKMTTDRKSFTK